MRLKLRELTEQRAQVLLLFRTLLVLLELVGKRRLKTSSTSGKSSPLPVEPTGVSNKVDDERASLKPGGPSRTLAA
jgi:hypothetical protein